ncbi:hypothetical protein F5Y04DRAFT_277330 [Hypomontagnella monticulosa]|nr:hypothetical protein F5Y04DRAFT_277330 [Hypomontagnella monticulosa]
MCPSDNNPGLARQASDWAKANPGKTAMYGAAGIALAVPALISGPLLAAAGFGANGIAAASLASAVQSGIGNVAAGSAFATLQSAGMAGYGAAVVNGAVQVGGAALAASATALRGARTQSPFDKTWSYFKTERCNNGLCPETLSKSGKSLGWIMEGLQALWDRIPIGVIGDLFTSVSGWVKSVKTKGMKTEY